jgi:hypothetical protein
MKNVADLLFLKSCKPETNTRVNEASVSRFARLATRGCVERNPTQQKEKKKAKPKHE